MRTAPPTVPGMLTPNSRPESPNEAARADACGRRAPPPQTRRSPSCSIRARSPSSFITSPRTPVVRNQQVRPRPDHSYLQAFLGRPSAAGSRAVPRTRRRRRTPPARRCGWSSAGRAESRARLPPARRSRALHQARGQLVDVAGAHRHQQVAVCELIAQHPRGHVDLGQPPDRAPACRGPPPRRRPAFRSPRRTAPPASRARRTRRAPPPRRQAPAPGRIPGACAACASRGGAGTRRSAAPARARGRPGASPRPPSDDGRSRRRSARPGAGPAVLESPAGGLEARERLRRHARCRIPPRRPPRAPRARSARCARRAPAARRQRRRGHRGAR